MNIKNVNSIVKPLLAIGILLFTPMAFSQERVHIKIKGIDTPYTWWASEVDSIYFDVKYFMPTGVDTLDLGLPSGAKWASADYTSGGIGLFSPSSQDRVKSDWGTVYDDGWHTPTESEFQELINNCNWTYVKGRGFTGTSKINNKEIFFPFTETTEESEGYYFTSDNKYLHLYLRLNKFQDEFRPTSEVGGYELAIRPVWSSGTTPVVSKSVTVSSSVSSSSVATTSASITLNFAGDYSDITRYGVIYTDNAALKDMLIEETPEVKILRLTNSPSSSSVSVTLEGLSASTQYYFRAYAYSTAFVGTHYHYQANSDTFTTAAESQTNPTEPITPVDPNADFPIPSRPVDLGLPSGVKWSPWNIGASAENGTGGYYGWGDPTGKLRQTYNSVYAGGYDIPDIAGEINLKDYVGTIDTDSFVVYDIAYKQWGGNWRLPRRSDFEELYKYCNFKQDYWKGDKNGIKGWIVKNKSSLYKDSLFIPMAGNINIYGDTTAVGINIPTSSFYWTSEASGTHPYRYLIEEKKGTAEARPYRFELYPIRPVYDGNPTPVDPSEDLTRKTIGYDENDHAIPGDGVDFGLPSGVKWAAWNVGSDSEGVLGDYYAWADTYIATDFTSDSYLSNYDNAMKNKIVDKFYPSIASETTYKTVYEYSYFETCDPVKTDSCWTDSAIVGSRKTPVGWKISDYDVVTKLWEGHWRMSTESDWQELFKKDDNGNYEYIVPEWAEIEGRKGLKISGKLPGFTDNYIFIPAGGRMSGSSVNYGKDVLGYYWTGTCASGSGRNTTYARLMEFEQSDFFSIEQIERFIGCQIRPVLEPDVSNR